MSKFWKKSSLFSQSIRNSSLRLKFGKSWILIIVSFLNVPFVQANEIRIGTATVDITPSLPVALMGQFHLRIADTVESPLTANVIALESYRGNRAGDIAIFVSCDVIGIPYELLKKVRNKVKIRIPELDVDKIILNATHSHTSPVLENGEEVSFRYDIPKVGVLQVEEYSNLFVNRVSDAIEKAWKNRRVGSIGWGLSHAAVGYNRRIVYADSITRLYGNTNQPDFSGIEGMDGNDVNSLFFWDKKGKLIATAINVDCPAQEMERNYAINADFWHPVREKLKKRFGSDLVVLGWTGAAGDQSPRPMFRIAAEERMTKLRKLTRLEEIARRIVVAVEDTYQTVEKERYSNVEFEHKTETLPLPLRLVTEKEYTDAKTACEKAEAQLAADTINPKRFLSVLTWNKDAVKRYELQQKNTNLSDDMELHVLRIGDIAICTNEFELFSEYGVRIQAQSPALQTFVIQLAAGSTGGAGVYLPTQKALKGGGYSAVIQSDFVGPQSGQLLVDSTVKLIKELFNTENQKKD